MTRLSFIALLLSTVAAAVAEDRVTVRTTTGAGKAVIVGRVADWTGETLRVRSGNDLREIPADRVVDVQTVRTQKHIDALSAFDAGKPDEAHSLLKGALDGEPRMWMRREILASLVKVDLARGDRAAAGTDFLALFDSDPTTRHFNQIPLDWRSDPPAAGLAATARSWVRSGNGDVPRLLGASALLFDRSDGEAATETLGKLAASTDRRVYPLARAQLWRRQLARGDVPEGEIKRWEDRIGEITEPLRGGAYWLVGQAWANNGDAERAATALLWLPLVYDSDPELAAEATVVAADELTKIGRTADAVVLYREATSRFRYTPAAKEARAALERLATQARETNAAAAGSE